MVGKLQIWFRENWNPLCYWVRPVNSAKRGVNIAKRMSDLIGKKWDQIPSCKMSSAQQTSAPNNWP